MSAPAEAPPPGHDKFALLVVSSYAAAFVAFGFLVDTPAAILRGLIEIATARGALITDYLGVGGTGAAFVNAGALTLCACLIYRVAGPRRGSRAISTCERPFAPRQREWP